MEVKTVEIRDAATFMPAMAIRLYAGDPQSMDHYLLRRAGYGADEISGPTAEPYVILMKLDGVEAQYDPFGWPNQRTLGNAHRFLIENWGTFVSGSVLDVEYILGEKPTPKQSERITYGQV